MNDSTPTSTTDDDATLAAQDAGGSGSQAERGLMLAAVSRAIVKIHKDYLGKGPVRARSHVSGNVLVVILEGGFLRGEQTLQERGHTREVVDSRHAMQDALKQEYKQAVETILYRSVRSFMSAADPEEDLQVEIFVLHPEASQEESDGSEDAVGREASAGA
jgi:uncharacterized protein YbcI